MTESTRYRVRPAMTFERQTFVYIVETWAGTFDSVHETAESAAQRADWLNAPYALHEARERANREAGERALDLLI